MSRELVQTAAKLLAKAQSTTSDYEAIALVERSYGLLADVINAYDLEHDGKSGARRRERRRLNERRRRARADAVSGADESQPGSSMGQRDSIARYRTAGDGGYGWRRGIDVALVKRRSPSVSTATVRSRCRGRRPVPAAPSGSVAAHRRSGRVPASGRGLLGPGLVQSPPGPFA